MITAHALDLDIVQNMLLGIDWEKKKVVQNFYQNKMLGARCLIDLQFME